MNRIEITTLLKNLRGAYPNTYIKDIKTMIDMWELNFGNEDADKVFKAARMYMNKGKKFPSPADIKPYITKAAIYDAPITPQLPVTTENLPEIDDGAMTGCDICPYFLNGWAMSEKGCHRENCIV